MPQKLKNMATRMKMLKLLQEVHGITHFGSRQTQPRTGALVLPLRPASAASKRKHIIRIGIQDPPDIPAPVKIIFIEGSAGRAAKIHGPPPPAAEPQV